MYLYISTQKLSSCPVVRRAFDDRGLLSFSPPLGDALLALRGRRSDPLPALRGLWGFSSVFQSIFLVSVLLSASVERCFVSRMRDFPLVFCSWRYWIVWPSLRRFVQWSDRVVVNSCKSLKTGVVLVLGLGLGGLVLGLGYGSTTTGPAWRSSYTQGLGDGSPNYREKGVVGSAVRPELIWRGSQMNKGEIIPLCPKHSCNLCSRL